jgi:hypothetical protein
MRRAEVHQKSVSRTPISPDGAGLRRPIRADGDAMESGERAGQRLMGTTQDARAASIRTRPELLPGRGSVRR